MRRGLGIGRTLVAIGSTLALIGSFLPWLTAGELSGHVVTENGLNGTGILVFLSCIGMLLLIALPYASSSGTSPLDKPLLYASLAGVGIAGLVIHLVQLLDSLTLWPPTTSPGLWLSIIGMVVVAIGVGELLGEKTPKSPVRTRR